MQALTVSDSLTSISRQLQVTARRLTEPNCLLAVLAGYGATIISASLAPGTSVSAWEWMRILLIVTGGVLAGAALAVAQDATEDLPYLTVALAATLLTLAIVATFGLTTAALCSLALSIVDSAIVVDRVRTSPEIAVVALAVLTPWWVWSALDAWDAGLLLLVPLAGLALNALGHARLGFADGPSPEQPSPHESSARLSPRGHRLGVWLSLTGGAALLLIIGTATGAADGWLVLGGAMSSAATAAAITSERLYRRMGRRLYPALPMLAFALLSLSWLASL